MSKIICEICGTSYQDTADQCPICGCSRDAAASLLGDDLLQEETVLEEPKAKSSPFSGKKKEIFDFDEVNSDLDEDEDDEDPYEEEDEDEDDDEEEDDEEEPRHNTFAVIFLTILIVVLLAVAGFLFVRYFLPNMGSEDVPPTTTAAPVETTAVTTLPTIPCQSLVLTSGTAELSEPGQYFLLHVQPMPEDTTDVITYSSANESIATVTEDGKITAVAEGETVIYITCGNSQLNCPVVVKFVEETEPPTEAPVETTLPETEPTEETAPIEETAPAEETTAPTQSGLKDVTLKLKKTDISLGVYYQYTLVLDCDLEPTEVEWSSEHPHIATVDENGVVEAKKEGTTAITAKYGDQTVQCIIRCSY